MAVGPKTLRGKQKSVFKCGTNSELLYASQFSYIDFEFGFVKIQQICFKCVTIVRAFHKGSPITLLMAVGPKTLSGKRMQKI